MPATPKLTKAHLKNIAIPVKWRKNDELICHGSDLYHNYIREIRGDFVLNQEVLLDFLTEILGDTEPTNIYVGSKLVKYFVHFQPTIFERTESPVHSLFTYENYYTAACSYTRKEEDIEYIEDVFYVGQYLIVHSVYGVTEFNDPKTIVVQDRTGMKRRYPFKFPYVSSIR